MKNVQILSYFIKCDMPIVLHMLELDNRAHACVVTGQFLLEQAILLCVVTCKVILMCLFVFIKLIIILEINVQ